MTSPEVRPVPVRWGRLAVLGVLVLGLVVFVTQGGAEWLSFDALNARRDQLLGFTTSHFWPTLLAWGLLYAVAVALSLPGAVVLSLFTGFLFGRVTGTLVIVVAATAGATVLVLLARYLFATAARERLEAVPRAARLLDGFEKGAFNYLLFLRLVPVFPFWLVNLAAAVTRVPVVTFAAATGIGIIPGSFVFANLGRSLGTISSPRGLVSPEILVALGLLGVLSLLPLVVRRFRDPGGDR